MTSAFHPQSDGQTKVLNRVVEQYLRSFVHHQPSTWGKFLAWAEYSHNTSWNSATGTTPYEVAFGRKPFSYPEYIARTSHLDVVDTILTDRDEVFQFIRRKLIKAQASMKDQANHKRRDVSYQPGDWVLLKLRPYRQSTAKGSQSFSGKLAKRFYDPFKILEHIGKVAYCLELPAEAKIRSVFHCSMLKPFRGDPIDSTVELPNYILNHQPVIVPMENLDYRRTNSPNATWEVLVQWQGLSPDDISWENWSQLQQAYHLEDKVIFQGAQDDKGEEAIIKVETGEHTEATAAQEYTEATAAHKATIKKA